MSLGNCKRLKCLPAARETAESLPPLVRGLLFTAASGPEVSHHVELQRPCQNYPSTGGEKKKNAEDV